MTSVYSTTLSSDNFGLQFLALAGDDEGVQDAIDSGANVNAIDASGRTALMCAVAGNHWSDISVAHDGSFMTPSRLKVIDILLKRPEISLYTLNAPQNAFNDATPLGMAAWLNMPEAVRVLLKSSLDSVAVDGTDMHGSTPLMYAARDGHLEIVSLLLQHGARPDIRALNHRSAIQYALSHPKVLYACETMLRRHRLHEWKTSTRSEILLESDNLFKRVASSLAYMEEFDMLPQDFQTPDTILECLYSDPEALHSTLFPTLSTHPLLLPLVNARDENGWSPIHHCASAPVPSIQVLDTLYCAGADVALFTEREHHTPLHCFAFSGHPNCSEETLYQYVNHLVHDLRAPLSARDKLGNTCLHIAAQRGRSVEVLRVLLKCDTSRAVRDLCNAKGLTALEVAKPQYRVVLEQDAQESVRPGSSLSTNTLRPQQSSIESHLDPECPVGKSRSSHITLADYDVFNAAAHLIDKLRISSPTLHRDSMDTRHMVHMESLISEMENLKRTIIGHFQARAQEVSDVLKDMEGDVQDTAVLLESVRRSVERKIEEHGLQPLTITRVSEDSEITCVSDRISDSSKGSKINDDDKSRLSTPGTLQPTNTPSHTNNSLLSTSNVSSKKVSGSTTSRFVAWIKRKTSANALLAKSSNPMLPTSSQMPQVMKKDIQDRMPVARKESDSSDLMRMSIISALRTSGRPIGAAGRELDSVRESLTSIKKLLQSTTRSVARAERILKRALKARRTMVEDLQKEEDLFIRGSSLSNKSSLASIASISTVDTSLGGLTAENDDEETRAIRLLLLRKIDAGLSGVLDEIENTNRCLLVIKNVIKGVKRRIYV
ncbi:ankyrin repeat-containing domain protein [Lentinula raphanica]|uniref:Ankyrin repeat-containing domain protein n=1 Tax=Lentinula raphanica TaxID=153919 RepID=A0AA38PKS3_9AGAR|nr:ankyrin repeat-containing domain protein [Lentinula raphanica]KAJ3844763.1 ankyrin repeat-containing domain protein [Lentinula raphanica]KAJ3973506.1 ankyrin repeat-containing domain protein [Lentinula raphanica]